MRIVFSADFCLADQNNFKKSFQQSFTHLQRQCKSSFNWNFFVNPALTNIFCHRLWLVLLMFEMLKMYPPASEASREVANLTWRKNPHTPVYGVKEFACLSVAKFDLNYLRTGEIFLSASQITKKVIFWLNSCRGCTSMPSQKWGTNYFNQTNCKSCQAKALPLINLVYVHV